MPCWQSRAADACVGVSKQARCPNNGMAQNSCCPISKMDRPFLRINQIVYYKIPDPVELLERRSVERGMRE
jgi:hypothetical protein